MASLFLATCCVGDKGNTTCCDWWLACRDPKGYPLVIKMKRGTMTWDAPIFVKVSFIDNGYGCCKPNKNQMELSAMCQNARDVKAKEAGHKQENVCGSWNNQCTTEIIGTFAYFIHVGCGPAQDIFGGCPADPLPSKTKMAAPRKAKTH